LVYKLGEAVKMGGLGIKKRPPTGERLGYAKRYFSSLKQSCPVGDAGSNVIMMVLGTVQGLVHVERDFSTRWWM
jgi:hypothetical protein